MTVLVGYASERGSTREIAERIGSVLSERGIRAEVLSFDDVADVTGYEGFVLGSAVHRQAWLPAALRFIARNAATLAAGPVWLFSVGMPAALPRKLHRWAMTEEGTAIGGLTTHLHPQATRLFSGDRTARLTPLTDTDADRLLHGLRSADALWEGAGPDPGPVRDVVLRVSRLAELLPEVAELDLNPLMAGLDGCTVLDARIRVEPRSFSNPFLRRLRQ